MCCVTIDILSYLVGFVDTYPRETRLWYDNGDGLKEHITSTGILHGSILHPPLSKVMYNDILYVERVDNAKGFGDKTYSY